MKILRALASARPLALVVVALGGTLALGAGCSDSGGSLRSSARLTVSVTSAPNTRTSPLALTLDAPTLFTATINALRDDGTVDGSYNGFVRISVKPGSVVSLTGNGTDGRNVQLANGVATNLVVGVVGSFGDTRVWAEDIGYVPVDPGRKPPPQCSNGLDDDGDGLIDFPAETGCAFANDDTEIGGTYATGASNPVYFHLPRIADVRGVTQGGTGTSFPHQQVLIDTGWNVDTLAFDYSTVVTRVSSDGFYATDLGDKRGFNSVFAFNFSAPPLMRVCDRLKYYGGTAADFFGFTEIGFPTWQLEEWDPNKRDCLVPEPISLKVTDLTQPPTTTNTPQLTKSVAALVRVETTGAVTLHVSKNFGEGYPAMPGLVPTATASNCDYNKDGKVDFTTDPEKTCSNNCTADPECTEYSNYVSRNAFRLVLTDTSTNDSRSILADGSSDPQFDPVAIKGVPMRSFTGTMRFFSGGAQYTIEARCNDDIVTDTKLVPVSSNTACVHPRTINDTEGSN